MKNFLFQIRPIPKNISFSERAQTGKMLKEIFHTLDYEYFEFKKN